MRTSHLIAVGFSTLALLDGVAAQRNGKNTQSATTATTSTVAAGAATKSSAATASPASSAAAGNAAKGAVLIGGGQPNSNSDGNPTAGQAASLTDPDNFINFCQGKTATNGLQNTAGSCNPIPMGEMPAKANMVSTVITSPVNGANAAAANTPFNIKLTTTNLQAGQFTNPNVAYYTAPQHLNAQGQIIGHVHVTVQNMGANINKPTPPDPTTFAFFKGINDAGDGKGNLQAVVTAGLPAGNYRICTMVAAANHQPVMMPVAQRGAQDDCIRVTIGGAGAAEASSSADAKTTGSTTSAAVAKGVVTSAGTKSSTTAAAVAVTTSSGKAKANGGNGASTAAASSSKTTSAATTATSATTTTSAANASKNGGNNTAISGAASATSAAASTSATASAAPMAGEGRGGRGGRARSARRPHHKSEAIVRERFIAREFIV